MLYYQAKTPIDYQEIFCKQIDLRKIIMNKDEIKWTNPEVGFIHSYGNINRIQSGVGNYTVTSNFFVEYQYSTVYLHFGIIYEGITYSLEKNLLRKMATPSVFVAVDKAASGVNCWKKGQHFKGVEVSVEMNYLKEVLLPFLGYSIDALDFLEENIRYVHLPDDMKMLILRVEHLLNTNKMTDALQTSICLEFISLLLHPDHKYIFSYFEQSYSRFVQIGKRKIKITRDDHKKIVKAYERIKKDAASFVTIYELSKELNISEQKLKAGFQELYQQTIWNFANNIRMNMATNLLLDSKLSVSEISQTIGYQSQAAFINTFKKWCGITPGQFRTQMQTSSQ